MGTGLTNLLLRERFTRPMRAGPRRGPFPNRAPPEWGPPSLLVSPWQEQPGSVQTCANVSHPPTTGRAFSPARPTDCFAIDLPGTRRIPGDHRLNYSIQARSFSLRMEADRPLTARLDEHREKWSFQACFILLSHKQPGSVQTCARFVFIFQSAGRGDTCDLRGAHGAAAAVDI